MLNLDWLHAFAVFAGHLNFTHAARELHISQPALHTQIGKLADELGVPLYRRVGRRLELTQDGVAVACFGRELSERVGEFREVLREGSSRRPVVLAAGEGAYLYVLGPAIGAYDRVGEGHLRLLTGDRETCLEALRDGTAHLAVAALETLPDDLDAHAIASFPQVVVVEDSHPLAGAGSVGLADLSGMRLVVPPPEREHRRVLERALRRAGVSWEVAVEATGWELMLHFVALGLGHAVVNGCCRIPSGFATAVVRDLPAVDYHVLHRSTPLGRAATALKERILAAGHALSIEVA